MDHIGSRLLHQPMLKYNLLKISVNFVADCASVTQSYQIQVGPAGSNKSESEVDLQQNGTAAQPIQRIGPVTRAMVQAQVQAQEK